MAQPPSALRSAVLIAGANGSGKTTFARQLLPLLHPGLVFLNADEIRHASVPPYGAISAAKEFLHILASIETVRQGFALETTLSSGAYAGRVGRWRGLGYHVILHFIELPTADAAVARVASRVAAGGHHVAEADVRRRFDRGRQLFSELYRPLVDDCYHWFSDDKGLRLAQRYSQR